MFYSGVRATDYPSWDGEQSWWTPSRAAPARMRSSGRFQTSAWNPRVENNDHPRPKCQGSPAGRCKTRATSLPLPCRRSRPWCGTGSSEQSFRYGPRMPLPDESVIFRHRTMSEWTVQVCHSWLTSMAFRSSSKSRHMYEHVGEPLGRSAQTSAGGRQYNAVCL